MGAKVENKLQNKVIKTIKQYNLINENDKIVVGVSGGPDSICLLNILNELKITMNIQLFVAHINHGLRIEAEEETEYVLEFCNKLEIPCFIKKLNILEKSHQEKIGTEEAGRKARYDFFEEILEKVGANKIATAHNANDNAETVLMNIFRGTGISGLKGIEPIRDGKFVRPLIECERSEIEKYCEENILKPKIDKSNYENIYTRNKVRNLIIPQIQKEFNPNIVQSVNRLSKLIKQENEFIQKYCSNILENELIIKDENDSNSKKVLVLELKKFNNLENAIKNRIVLMTIQKVIGNTQGIEKKHIDDIVKLCAKNIGNKYLTPNKRIKVLVKGGKIYFENITFLLQ